MKYIITLFIFSFSFLALPIVVFAQAATLSLDPASGTFNKGCTFALKVNLDTGGAQTDGTDAIIIYDPSRFSINSSSIVSNTNVYPDFPGNTVDEAAGKITVAGLASVVTPFSGKGTLATLNFTVKEEAPTGVTQMTFDFDPNNKANTRDSNVVERATIADLLNSVVNGSYTIGTGTCAQASPSPKSQGGPSVIATPSARTTTKDQITPVPEFKTLPEGGTIELTSAVAIVGVVLTVLGILGLALL